MATGSEALRDGERPVDQLLPPGENSRLDHEAPGSVAGSFLVGQTVDMPYVGEPPFTFQKLIDKRGQLRTIRYRRHGDIPGEPTLPPLDAWLVDPAKTRLETPVDDRGLVKQDELVDMVYGLIDPEFRWPKGLSVDHVYHNEEWYYSVWAPDCGGTFRESPIHKMLVRRMWENVKHRIMIPAAVPTEEVMLNRLEAWEVASDLLRSIRNAERVRYYAVDRYLQRGGDPEELTDEFKGLDRVTREWALTNLDRHLSATEQNLERLRSVPPEFRLVHPEAPRSEMAERLAKVAAAEALHMVRRPAA